MNIIDERTQKFNPMGSKLIFAGYSVSESNIKEMLQFMGVRPTQEVIQEAIGYMSSHAMEINMVNLHNFIKEKGYDKTRLDLREKKSIQPTA